MTPRTLAALAMTLALAGQAAAVPSSTAQPTSFFGQETFQPLPSEPEPTPSLPIEGDGVTDPVPWTDLDGVGAAGLDDLLRQPVAGSSLHGDSIQLAGLFGSSKPQEPPPRRPRDPRLPEDHPGHDLEDALRGGIDSGAKSHPITGPFYWLGRLFGYDY